MDAIQVISPLIGVVIGATLTGLTSYLKARKERKRIIAIALADLLEVRHRVVVVNMVLGKMKTIAKIPDEMMPVLRNLFDSIAPIDSRLDERYDRAVTQLAGADPVLAFSLRAKNTVPRMIAALRNQVLERGENLAAFELLETTMLATVKPILDSAVVELAQTHSFFTKRQVVKLLNNSDDVPLELAQFFEKLTAEIKLEK